MPKTELACGTCHDLYDFGGSRKGIENGGQKASKSDPKIDIWALWGSIFKILGVFLERSDFRWFFERQSFGRNSQKRTTEDTFDAET